MKRYLLDTSILSLMAPGKASVPMFFKDWFRAHAEQLFISTITVAEVQQGISKLQRTGANRRAQLLVDWLHELVEAGGERIVSFDTNAALKAGEISDTALSQGRHPGFPDVAIAAIGSACDMTVLTLNVRHFEPLGISVADPSDPTFLDAR